MPEYFILEATGKTAIEFFETPPAFSGSHDKTAELVQSGRVQAGVLNFEVYDRRVREGKTDPEVCRVIWQTQTFADYNLTAHPEIDRLFGPGSTERVKTAFLEMDDPELLAAFGRGRMVEATNEDFEGIRAVAAKLGMIR